MSAGKNITPVLPHYANFLKVFDYLSYPPMEKQDYFF